LSKERKKRKATEAEAARRLRKDAAALVDKEG